MQYYLFAAAVLPILIGMAMFFVAIDCNKKSQEHRNAMNALILAHGNPAESEKPSRKKRFVSLRKVLRRVFRRKKTVPLPEPPKPELPLNEMEETVSRLLMKLRRGSRYYKRWALWLMYVGSLLMGGGAVLILILVLS